VADAGTQEAAHNTASAMNEKLHEVLPENQLDPTWS